MKRSVLVLLLSAFVFISIHDWVIKIIDNDTQTELILVEHGKIKASMMCDVSEIHQHLHELIISYKIAVDEYPKTILKLTNSFITDKDTIPQLIPLSIYRPPIS